jgi:hypothetical protein
LQRTVLHYHVSPKGLISTLNDHAERGWLATCQASSAIAAGAMKKSSGLFLKRSRAQGTSPLFSALRRRLGRGCHGGQPLWQNTIEYKWLGARDVPDGCVCLRVVPIDRRFWHRGLWAPALGQCLMTSRGIFTAEQCRVKAIEYGEVVEDRERYAHRFLL